MRQLEGGSNKDIPTLKLLTRDKDDKDKKNFAKLIDTIKGSKNGKAIGVFAKDKFPGPFMDLWRDAIRPEGNELCYYNLNSKVVDNVKLRISKQKRMISNFKCFIFSFVNM